MFPRGSSLSPPPSLAVPVQDFVKVLNVDPKNAEAKASLQMARMKAARAQQS